MRDLRSYSLSQREVSAGNNIAKSPNHRPLSIQSPPFAKHLVVSLAISTQSRPPSNIRPNLVLVDTWESAVLRMAYDDLRMQRWGLQAKLVHTTGNTADRTEVSEPEVEVVAKVEVWTM